MTVSGRKQSTAQVISNPPAPVPRLEENGKEHGHRLDNGKEKGKENERGKDEEEEEERRNMVTERVAGEGLISYSMMKNKKSPESIPILT